MPIIVQTLSEKRFFEWHVDDKSVTLRNRGGQLRTRFRSTCDKVGCINARDYKGIGNQYVMEGKLIIEEYF